MGVGVAVFIPSGIALEAVASDGVVFVFVAGAGSLHLPRWYFPHVWH